MAYDGSGVPFEDLISETVKSQVETQDFSDKKLGDYALGAVPLTKAGSEYMHTQQTHTTASATVSSDLAELRRTLQEDINISSHSTSRRLNILDLPDEILSIIFELLRDSWGRNINYVMERHGMGGQQIMNVRLSCRRFCGASSHLLIRYARVRIDLASLARLEELSKHPLLRRGVRAVEFNLSYFSSVLALDIREFVRYVLEKFRTQHEDQLKTTDPVDDESEETFRQNLQHGRAIIDSWQLFLDDIVSDDPEMALRQLVLWKAHAEYQRRYFEQQRLILNGTFLRSVSTAISALPNATEFRIHDDGFTISINGLVSFSQIHDEEALVYGMLRPHAWEEDKHFLDDRPYQVLFMIPGYLYRAGVTITVINCELTIEDEVRDSDSDSDTESRNLDFPSEKDLHDITMAVQKLKRFFFCRQSLINSYSLTPDDPNDIYHTAKYIGAHLAATSIQELLLDLSFLCYSEWDPADFSILKTLNLRRYPFLNHLRLSGITMDIVDLKHLFEPILVPLNRLEFTNIHLLTGAWEEALDVLRSKGSVRTSLYRLHGAECDTLRTADRKAIFDARPSNGQWSSKAEDYVRGTITKNPLSRARL